MRLEVTLHHNLFIPDPPFWNFESPGSSCCPLSGKLIIRFWAIEPKSAPTDQNKTAHENSMRNLMVVNPRIVCYNRTILIFGTLFRKERKRRGYKKNISMKEGV